MQSFRHHYPVRPVDTPQLCLRGIGIHERMGPGTVHRPQGIDTYLFVLFYLEAANTGPAGVREIPPGSLMIWTPNTPHQFGNKLKRWDHTWMLAGGSLLKKELTRLRIPTSVPLPIPASNVIEHAFQRMDQEAGHAPVEPAYIRNVLQNLLIDLARLIHKPEARLAIPREYQEVKVFMEEHFSTSITLEQLAARVHRSVPRFATRFKEFFGVSPLEYLIQLRLQHARFLLLDRSYNIAEVGQAVGYENSNYFSRLFRMRYGLNPTQVREQAEGGRPLV